MTTENTHEENANEGTAENDEITTDPWAGYPDSPWTVDGYSIDDAICDHIMQLESRYDGVKFVSGREALEHLLEELRARRFDAKPVAARTETTEES